MNYVKSAKNSKVSPALKMRFVAAMLNDGDLTMPEKLVATAIVSLIDPATGFSDEVHRKISDLCGVTRQTVIASLKTLERAGWVGVFRPDNRDGHHFYECGWLKMVQSEAAPGTVRTFLLCPMDTAGVTHHNPK